MADTTNVAVNAPAEGKAMASAAPVAGGPFEEMRREAERLFEAFEPGAFVADPFNAPAFARLAALARRPAEAMWPFAPAGKTAMMPAVDVAEKAGEYEITAELPGLEAGDVDVKVTGGVLTIRAEKRDVREEKDRDYFVSERRYGTFARSFRLPDGVDRAAIEAGFARGVLTIRLPKIPAAREEAQTIAVKPA